MADAKLDKDEIAAHVGKMIDAARAYLEGTLEPPRTKATDYYHARPFGNEETGRSQVVLSVVRDTVLQMMPDLMEIFFGSERPVEYEPRRLDAAPMAQQQTDYVRYIVAQDNPGYIETQSAFEDGLVRRIGFIKWWWDDAERVAGYTATGLSQDGLLQLLMDPEVEIEILTDNEDADYGPSMEIKVVRRQKSGRARIAAIPGEELAWNQNAKDLQSATIVVHTRLDMRYYELIQMGYTEADLEGADGASDVLGQNTTNARRNDQGSGRIEDDSQDPQNKRVRYDEAYTYMQIDPAIGVALYKTCHVGTAHKVVGEPELMTSRPFAPACPYPQAHVLEGLSLADLTMDLQLIESAVMRGTLDSLSLSLQQDTEIVDGMVNMKDWLNPERGKGIRVRQPGMIREIPHKFLGDYTLPILDKLEDIKADRTGRTKASEGLDSDVLQSTTKAAVTGTLTKAQRSLKYIARNLAETCFKPLFRGLLELVIQNQDQPRMVRLRGQYVQVDPRSWDATMDVRVNVGLGGGLPEDRIASLQNIAMDQTNILAQMGPQNPFVTLAQASETRRRIVELSGFPSADEFYKKVTPEDEQAAIQAAAQAPKGDPATEALAQSEAQKNQIQATKNELDIQMQQQELALKEKEMYLTDDRERDKQAADVAVALAEIDAKYQTNIDREKFKVQMEQERAALDVAVGERKAALDRDLEHRKATIAAEADKYKAELDANAKMEVAKTNAKAKAASVEITRDPVTRKLTAKKVPAGD